MKIKSSTVLLLTGITMLTGMSVYEFLKQSVWPDVSIWQSHIITIVFTSALAMCIALIICRSYNSLVDNLIDEQNRRLKSEKEKREIEEKLSTALAKVLSGYISICSNCKQVKDNEGNWHTLEFHIHKHTAATFTHGLCASCSSKLYPDLYPSGK